MVPTTDRHRIDRDSGAAHTQCQVPSTDRHDLEFTVRAAVQRSFGGPEVLTIEDASIPDVIPTEVRVQVEFAGVNPVDAKVRAGASVAAFAGNFPLTVGWDIAGVIESVGAGVTRFAVGDRVFGMPRFPRPARGYAELVTAPSRQLALIPSGVETRLAASLPLASITAWQLVADVASISEGDRVLILGAGGAVGRLATQLAKKRGAQVITTGSKRSIALLAELGADRQLLTDELDGGASLGELDAIIDLIGHGHGVREVRRLRPGGILVVVPTHSQAGLAEVAASAAIHATGMIVEPDRGALEGVAALLGSGALSFVEPKPFAFGEVRRVHELLDAGSPEGKMVLDLAF
jgi:NADPH:quinone reductase-like Zn-dependent oxidoreductase